MLLEKINLAIVKTAYAQDIAAIEKEKVAPYEDIGDILSAALQISLVIAGLIVLLMVIMGGIQYMTSGGDKEEAQAAQKRITAALVGLVIVVSAYALAVIIEKVFGVSIVTGINLPEAQRQIGK